MLAEKAPEPGLPPLPRRSEIYGLRGILEAPLLVAIALLMAVGLQIVAGQAFVIPSGSMRPQLIEGDRVLVSRFSYRLHELHRGDVIVFEGFEDEVAPRVFPGLRLVQRALETVGLRQPPHEDFIKRIVGLPGEVVEARNGVVYVDGKLLIEPYLPPGVATSSFEPFLVPDGRVFVLGDNRPNSRDSRFVGPVPIGNIVGRAILRFQFWPPGRRLAFL